MNAFLLVLFGLLSHISAQCIEGLLAGFAMDELGGTILRDSTVLRRTIPLNASFTYSSVNNPQGLSSLVFGIDGQLVMNPFPRPTQYTITMWFLTSDQGESALFSWVEPVVGYTFYARIMQGRVGVALNTVMGSQLSTRTYNDARWHFLVAFYSEDSQTVTLIIDPHTQAEVVQSLTGPPRAYTLFQIGGIPTRDLSFSGQMDDFRVYNVRLSSNDMQKIAFQLDTPCTASKLIAQRALYQSWIPSNAATTFVLDTSQTSVCGARDLDGFCTNNRYGIAITACAGTLAGFASKVVIDSTVLGQKDTVPSNSTCAVAFDGSKYPSGGGVDNGRLCMSASRVISVNSQVNPIVVPSGIPDRPVNLNQVTFTSGPAPIRVEVSVIVADVYNSYNPTAKAITPQTPVVTCNGNYLEARWSTPTLNNGLTCNACTYQAWYSPLSKVTADRVNLAATCGVKMYGTALPDIFTGTFYNQFVLPTALPVPGDSYVWVVMARSADDGVEGVVAVLDRCPIKSPSVAPTPAPTFPGGVVTHNDINSNSLVLNLLAQDFPPGPPRDGFTNQFVMSLATVLNTDVPRFNVTSFTPKSSDKVAVGFDIGLPVPGSDNRTAGTLALLLWNQHKNRSSLLYTVLPNTNPEPASFVSNYEHIPLWNGNDSTTVEENPFPWQYIVIIIAAIAGLICCCCIVYCCYHRFRDPKEKRPTRTRGVEIEQPHHSHQKPQRFYDDDDKHAHSDHINFPQARSPTRGGNDLETARRIGTSPDTRSTPVSYKGATLNASADEGPAPHLDPRDWKSVVALHGRTGGTVAPGDLVFNLGDSIRVVGPCDGPHWFEGELRGQRGMVPVNHVKGQTPADAVRLHRT